MTIDHRTELLFTDMSAIFGSADNLSTHPYQGKWQCVPYKHKDFEGTMVYSGSSKPQNLSFDPQLTGWYKIYVGIMLKTGLDLKLSGDPCFFHHEGSRNHKSLPGNYFEESLWRMADLTGQSIQISTNNIQIPHETSLTHLRFVPMTEEEVAALLADDARQDTKRIYASDDIHNVLYFHDIQKMEDFFSVVTAYEHSDVEWIAMEENRAQGRGVYQEDYSYPREGDRNFVRNLNRCDMDQVYKALVDLGHEKGYKMSISLRMGAWGMGFHHEGALENDFAREHPEFRCVDRNGEEFFALSYAYPEVQDYIIQTLIRSAKSGCDAVTLIGHRGYPYVLFEKPVADRFYAQYGEYPYELPLDEPRLRALHCEIMTEFARKLRNALDEAYGKNKVEIHLRTLYSIEDTLKYALDAESWAKEGLITTIVSYPMCHQDKLEGCFREDAPDRIDLEKYTAYIYEMGRETVKHLDPDIWELRIKNSPLLEGVISEEDRIAQWNALEDQYGVKVYIELMDRLHPNALYRQRLLELYQTGARRIAYWDTCVRRWSGSMWNVARLGGHTPEEIQNIDADADWKIYRPIHLGNYHIGLYSPTWGG